MSDLLDEDVEFRGGTLQLSTDAGVVETAGADAANKGGSQSTVHPSVLSGADSLTSSSSSFAGKDKKPVLYRAGLHLHVNIFCYFLRLRFSGKTFGIELS